MSVLTDGPFVVRVGQVLLAQGAALRERLLVHLFPNVANQDLEGRGRGERGGEDSLVFSSTGGSKTSSFIDLLFSFKVPVR